VLIGGVIRYTFDYEVGGILMVVGLVLAISGRVAVLFGWPFKE
jgi:hypothetical protein